MKKFFAVIGFALFAFAAKAQTQRIFMPFFETINMNTEYQYSTAKLLQSYTSDGTRYELVLPPKPDASYAIPSDEKIREMAQAAHASLYAKGELNRVGETVIVSFALYNVSDDKMVWKDRLKANSPEDLDPIMKKLANKMGTAEKATQDGDMYSVTAYDAKDLNKIQATYRFGLMLGAGAPLGSFVTKPITGLGIAGSYDTRNFLFDLRGQYLFTSGNSGTSLSMFTGSIEGYYPLKAQNNTPFFGGGFGISYASLSSQTPYSNYYGYSDTRTLGAGGLTIIVGGGYLINRNSTVNLRIGANIFSNLYDVDSKYISGAMLRLELFY